jgi:hypothetical protein
VAVTVNNAGQRLRRAGGDADFVNGTTVECDGGMLPGVLYDAG